MFPSWGRPLSKQSEERSSNRRLGEGWNLHEFTEFVEACYDRDTTLDAFLGFAGDWFGPRLVLIVGRGWVQLFASEGFGVSDDLDRRARRADVAEDAPVLTQSESTGTADEIGLGTLFEQLEVEPRALTAIGVEIGKRIAIILVGEAEEGADVSRLVAAAGAVGNQLETVIRLTKTDRLPPMSERIPPLPRQTDKSARRTQALGSRPVETARTMSGPGFTVDSEPEEAESLEAAEANPAATSFGLPVAGDHGPSFDLGSGEDSAEDLPVDDYGDPPVSTAPGMATSSAGEPSEAVEGPEKRAAVEEAAPDDELDEDSYGAASPGTVVGVPVQPEPSEASDQGVWVEEPQDVGGGASRTALGGLRSTINGEVGVVDSSVDTPSNQTALGGLGASPDMLKAPTTASDEAEQAEEVVHDIHGSTTKTNHLTGEPDLRRPGRESAPTPVNSDARARIETPAVAQDPSKSAADDEEHEKGSTSAAGWINTVPVKKGVPQAMILKPGRKRKAADKSGVAGARRPDRGASDDNPFKTSEETRKAVALALSSERKHRRKSQAGREVGRRKVESSREVDDAWLDSFADDVPGSEIDRTRDALDFSISEADDDPHSLPPETLEKLLDSGPQMVDMQEAFLVLDSREPDVAFEAAEAVSELGTTALDVLEMMFPGRIFLDRYAHKEDLPPVNEHGPLLHALVRIGDPAIELVRRHLEDSSNETRFYAVFLFTKLDATYALGQLFSRLFDRDQQIRELTADILLDYQSSPPFDREVRKPLRAELLSGEDLHVDVAARLLGRLKDPDAIVALIDTLEENDSTRVKASVLDALRNITLHNLSSPYEWRRWWEKGRDQSREDWIVQALDSDYEVLRRLAFDEVQRLPGLELNYHPDQPPKLRQRAQRELRQWFGSRN